MILVTGGAYQGKLEIAKTLWEQNHRQKAEPPSSEPLVADGNLADFTQLQQADIIRQFQLWIRRLLLEKKDPYDMTQQLIRKNPQAVFTLEQVGCGLVPVDAGERRYRETVGRIGCLLAQQSGEVYLVNCGISQKIK